MPKTPLSACEFSRSDIINGGITTNGNSSDINEINKTKKEKKEKAKFQPANTKVEKLKVIFKEIQAQIALLPNLKIKKSKNEIRRELEYLFADIPGATFPKPLGDVYFVVEFAYTIGAALNPQGRKDIIRILTFQVFITNEIVFRTASPTLPEWVSYNTVRVFYQGEEGLASSRLRDILIKDSIW